MLLLELQKIRNKKWMFACLLLGAVLLFASAVSFPMYRTAVLDRMLDDQFEEYMTTTGKWPMQMKFSFQVGKSGNMDSLDGKLVGVNSVYSSLGVPEYNTIYYYSSTNNAATPELSRGEEAEFSLKAAAMSQIEDHITIIDGSFWEDTDPSDGTLDVIVSEQTFLSSSMVIGDVFSIKAISPKGSSPVRLKVVGVFDITDPSEVYWQEGSKFFTSALFVQYDTFMDYFVYNPDRSKFAINVEIYSQFDYTTVDAAQAGEITNATNGF